TKNSPLGERTRYSLLGRSIIWVYGHALLVAIGNRHRFSLLTLVFLIRVRHCSTKRSDIEQFLCGKIQNSLNAAIKDVVKLNRTIASEGTHLLQHRLDPVPGHP